MLQLYDSHSERGKLRKRRENDDINLDINFH